MPGSFVVLLIYSNSKVSILNRTRTQRDNRQTETKGSNLKVEKRKPVPFPNSGCLDPGRGGVSSLKEMQWSG